jgi:hypothetical protein
MRTIVRVAVGLAAAGLAAGAYVAVRSASHEPDAVPPPIGPAVGSVSAVAIPDDFLTADAKSSRPVADQGLRWERAHGPDLPTLVNPCGTPLASDADRVAARQVALVGPQLWKLERLVVYRDTDAARRALAERRDGLARCAEAPEGNGVRTVWRWESLDIGEEAMFVAGQRFRGDRGLPGHHRAVLVRQGRNLVMFVDFGQARTLADRSEVSGYERDAATMAAKLRDAPWD